MSYARFGAGLYPCFGGSVPLGLTLTREQSRQIAGNGRGDRRQHFCGDSKHRYTPFHYTHLLISKNTTGA